MDVPYRPISFDIPAPSAIPEFERDILRDRVKAGIAQARKERKESPTVGRSAALHLHKITELFGIGISKREIAKQLGISRTSVRRLLAADRS